LLFHSWRLLALIQPQSMLALYYYYLE